MTHTARTAALRKFHHNGLVPTWNNSRCCDGFDTAADDSQVLFTVCCGSPRATKMWHGGPGMSPYGEVSSYPDDGLFPGFRFPDIVDTFGPGDFVALTVDCTVPGDDDDDNGCSGTNGGEGGVYIATGATVGSISWTEIGDANEPPTGGDDKMCAVKAALDGGVPTFYVQVGRCNGVANDDLYRFVGTRGRGVWRVSFNQPPIADADGPYTTDEGTDVQLDGTGSYDPSPGGSIVSYEWDFDNDGQYDDAVGAEPFFDPVGDGVGQDGVYTVGLRVTDNDGLTDTDESTVTVNNVAPSVAPDSNSPRNENTTITVTAIVTDPGWLDVLSATIDWGLGGGPVAMTQTGSDNTRPDARYTFSATFIYGDNGVFTAQVCGYDDDTSTCANINLTILNVNPTVAIDETDIVEGCGGDAFIAHAGEDVTFTGNATDPGSDDLDLTWSWGDGTPDLTTTYLVNPPATDPLPSPSIQPRDVTDIQSHAFEMACLYEVTFSALDDDGGSDSDTTDVVIAGNAEQIRSAGYWRHNYRGRGRRFFSDEQLQCYLDVVGHLSAVFSEITAASTIDEAEDVLNPSHSNGDMRIQFDRQLLAVWLNFANGAIEHDELVDTDFDDVPDTALFDVLCAAEAARANPATTRDELENWKDILEGINLMDEGGNSS